MKGKTGLQVAKGWKDIAVETIRKRLAKLKVQDTGALISSVQMYVQQTGLSSYKATLLYNYYGIFPDKGAGKGQHAGDATANKLVGGGRKVKNWTRAIAGETHRFGELMADQMANAAVEKIAKSLSVVKTIRFEL